jgi:hypothetical protein
MTPKPIPDRSCGPTGFAAVMLWSILALVVTAPCRGAKPTPRPTPTPVEEILDGPSTTDAEALLAQGRGPAALEALARVRDRALADSAGDVWLRALDREVEILMRPWTSAATEEALRRVERASPPPTVEIEVARLLLLAALYERTSFQLPRPAPGDREAESQLRLAAADATWMQAFSRRAGLGSKGRDALIITGSGPAVHSTARDVVSYLFVDFLIRKAHREDLPGEHPRPVDPKALLATFPLGVEPRGHPLARCVAVLDDLERWHATHGRRDSALEARLERTRIVSALIAPPGQQREVAADLKRRLAAYRDVPWWSMGMAQLALYVNDHALRAEEPLAIALEGARAYPKSPGGQRCETIARILRLELDDPEVSLVPPARMTTSGPVLTVRHRGPAIVHFRAWPRPLDITSHEAWSEIFWNPRDPRSKVIGPAPADAIAWDVTLPVSEGRELLETPIALPLPGRGLYRIEATLAPGFSRSVEGINVLVTDLILFVSDAGPRLEVRALSASTGRPVAGTEISSLAARSGAKGNWQLAVTSTTGPDGLVVVDRPASGTSLAIVGRHGSDVARAAVGDPPQAAAAGPVHEAVITLGRGSALPGERVRWRALVRRRHNDWSGYEPAAGASFPMMLRYGYGPPMSSTQANTNEFGSATGELVVPSPPAGVAPDRWHLELYEPAANGSPAKTPLATAYLGTPDPPRTLDIVLDELAPADGGTRVRLSGLAVGTGGRPLAGAPVSWALKCAQPAAPPPRLARSVTGNTNVVDSGQTTAGLDGRFQATSRVIVQPPHYPGLELLVTVWDRGGRSVSVGEHRYRDGAAVALTLRGPTLFREGEAATVIADRHRREDRLARPGSSVARLLRLLPSLDNRPFGDTSCTSAAAETPAWRGSDAESLESVVKEMTPGPEVARIELHHDERGLANAMFPPPAPGLYRVVVETDDGYGGVAHASRSILVAGPDVRLPRTLALLDGATEFGPRRAYVASCAAAGQVVLELHRAGRTPETRVLDSPANLLVELPDDRAERVAVRAETVHGGRVLWLERSLFGRPSDDLRLTIERLLPELVCRVSSADGAPLPGAEVIAVAMDGRRSAGGVDPYLWTTQVSHPASFGSGLPGWPVSLLPESSSGWGGLNLPELTSEESPLGRNVINLGGHGSRHEGVYRPRLPPAASLERVWESSLDEPLEPLTDPQSWLWEPRLVSDAEGRIAVFLTPPPGARTVRVALAATSKDGRVGFIETLFDLGSTALGPAR